ncbi:glycosyltransferase family 4 protein [Vibrio parahaemolyticus]|nr:glycosyltransferase family 4 protein [Vibrio parahaemolyticus]MDF4915462.1 glycosyltransferase family 4 protein [Vibrio parahaemolyticus]WMO23034.1 glycosyltransferase family 4 protein [Vibrio parahaemolyticus]HBC3953550.1 glycosyltransferase family 4 protein [Vibrio parahaemolyticus]
MKNRLVFLQPALPNYRVSFFESLIVKLNYDVEIYASPSDFLNVKTVQCKGIKLVGNFIKIGPFYWQVGLKVGDISEGDIIVISGNPRIINYMLLYFKCKIKKRKVIWWGQGWTAGSKGISSRIRRKLMLLADGIAVYTEKESKEISHKNIIGLNNGLDLKSIPIFDKKLATKDEVIRLVFIGRLTEKANLSILFKALSKVRVSYHLNIIGEGDIKNGLELLAEELDISSNITWHGKLFNNENISKITNLCDVFIYPGAVGLSLIHAFSLSLPALVHNDEDYHMPEFAAFEENYNGVSFSRDNIESLSNVIDSLDKNKLIQMSSNARNTVKESFNTEDMANRFCALIRKVNEKNIN